MVKSGLEKIFLKFLHAGDYFSLLHKSVQNHKQACILGFPRDGMSRCPFVQGQKKFLVPVSLCPGTRAGANVPGQTPLSLDKMN